MQSKSESANQLEPDPHSILPATVYSEQPWWRGVGYNSIPRAVPGGNVSNSSSLDCPNGSDSNDDQSMSNNGVNEEGGDANKKSQAPTSSWSVGNCGQENPNVRQGAAAIPTMRDECFTQPPQLELVGHSIACASNPYQDPYYGGMMATYGHQPLGYPQYIGTPHARMRLPLEMSEEPVYVNAKQYMGILRRRQARAKAEIEKKLIKIRKPYLHESRHQHAMKRARGNGGRFAKKTDKDDSKGNGEEKEQGSGPICSSKSGSSSGSEPLQSNSAKTWNSSASQEDARGLQTYNTHEAHNHGSGSGFYQNHSGLQALPYPSHLGIERKMESVQASSGEACPQTSRHRGLLQFS